MAVPTALYPIPIIGQISIGWPDYSNCVKKTALLLVSSVNAACKSGTA
jgi:hypothetical protein